MNFFRELFEGSDLEIANPKVRFSKRFRANDGKKELELEDTLQVRTAPKSVQGPTKDTKKLKVKAQSSDNKTSKTAAAKTNFRTSITDLQPDRGTVNLDLRQIKRRITEKISIDPIRKKLLKKLKYLNDKKDTKTAEYKELVDEIKKLFRL